MRKIPLPGMIAVGVFLTCFAFIWFGQKEHEDLIIYAVSLFYGVLCLGFLIFQLYAFTKAHLEYDEDIENVKYDVFKAEEEL